MAIKKKNKPKNICTDTEKYIFKAFTKNTHKGLYIKTQLHECTVAINIKNKKTK